MPDIPSTPSFENVCGMSQTQFAKLTKQQLSLALRDAIDVVEQQEILRPTNFSPQMLKATVTETVAEIRKELLLETRRLIEDLQRNLEPKIEGMMTQLLSSLRMDMIFNLMDEIQRRESKQSNVVIFGLHRKQDFPADQSQVMELLSTIGADENIAQIKRCFRGGTRSSRSRLFKVIFDSQEARQSVLQAAFRLSRLRDDYNYR